MEHHQTSQDSSHHPGLNLITSNPFLFQSADAHTWQYNDYMGLFLGAPSLCISLFLGGGGGGGAFFFCIVGIDASLLIEVDFTSF
jgi:hypothetical protein